MTLPAHPRLRRRSSGARQSGEAGRPNRAVPDSLIASILPASVYPVEIVLAARFIEDASNVPKIDGEDGMRTSKPSRKFRR